MGKVKCISAYLRRTYNDKDEYDLDYRPSVKQCAHCGELFAKSGLKAHMREHDSEAVVLPQFPQGQPPEKKIILDMNKGDHQLEVKQDINKSESNSLRQKLRSMTLSKPEVKSPILNRAIDLLTSPSRMLSKPFTCTFNDCLAQLATLVQWKSHVREHLGIRPYHCNWDKCPFSASAKSQVYTHVRVDHFRLPRFKSEQKEKGIIDCRDAMQYIVTREGSLNCLLPQQHIYEPWLLKYIK